MEVKLGWNELTIDNTLYMVDERVIDYIRELKKGYCPYMKECNLDTNDCMQEEYHKMIKANVNLCNRIYKAIDILKGDEEDGE